MESEKILPKILTSDILPLSRAVYQTVIEEFVNDFSHHEGVIWIGQFGSIGTPGISDIDLIVVCEEEHYKEVKRGTQKFIKQTSVHQYTIWNGGLVFPQNCR